MNRWPRRVPPRAPQVRVAERPKPTDREARLERALRISRSALIRDLDMNRSAITVIDNALGA